MLQSLPELDQRIVEGVILSQLPPQEVADFLSISVAEVEERLSWAIGQLQEHQAEFIVGQAGRGEVGCARDASHAVRLRSLILSPPALVCFAHASAATGSGVLGIVDGKDAVQLEGHRPFQLRIGTARWVAIGAPTSKRRRVAKPVALQVVVGHFDD